MKTKLKIFAITLLVAGATLMSSNINAQTDPPPPPPSGHGGSSNQPPGGGAPIGGGLFILLGLGVVYGAKKLIVKKEKE
ncbi:MAG: hypothetical protein JEY97_00245 [Bacteroidales bacterium]|nr:hypothetical protein [Bacteroidales bacterium]